MSAKLKKLKRKEVALSENEETEDDDDNVLYSLTAADNANSGEDDDEGEDNDETEEDGEGEEDGVGEEEDVIQLSQELSQIAVASSGYNMRKRIPISHSEYDFNKNTSKASKHA